MIRSISFLLSATLLLGLLGGCRENKSATLIIVADKVYTMNESHPQAQAVAVSGERILLAGSKDDVMALANSNTRIIELPGQTVLPGFVEGHAHIMDIGYSEMNLKLAGLQSFDEVVEAVRAAVSKAKPGEWIVGKGWHQDKWQNLPEEIVQGFPVHKKISEVSPDNPVFLEHASGHAALANAKAMQLSGVLPLSREAGGEIIVSGGEIIRDENGNPTGLFNENALELISSRIPRNDEKALELALEACRRNGITSFHDAGAKREHIALFKSFRDQKKLTPGLYVMLTGFDRDLVYEYFKNGPAIDPEGTLTIRSVKLNCDGALGSRGAWLLEEYSDDHGNHGMPTLPMDTVLKTARLALSAGFQVCSHAIGDRANKEILDRYEIAFKEQPELAKDHRFRIEHAQHLHPNDIHRFGALGVIPAMQAIHMSSDRPWAIQRLGEQRIVEGAYVWQSLLRSGARIVNGTDAPVEPLNPIACFYASVSRKTLMKTPEDGYEPAQKMTREQALRSYTLDAAYGAFEEKIKGSIEKGKLANFTVVSKDIMDVPEEEILSSEVTMTIVNGQVVYKK